MTSLARRAFPAAKKSPSRVWLGFLPEGFAVLGVEVDGPQPFGRPVRSQTADVDGEVIELVAARRCPGLLDQGDGYAVTGATITR
jgi:hypothetical protein